MMLSGPLLEANGGILCRRHNAPISLSASRYLAGRAVGRQSLYELVGISSWSSFSRLAPAVNHPIDSLPNFASGAHGSDLHLGLGPAGDLAYFLDRQKIGRASCRERV